MTYDIPEPMPHPLQCAAGDVAAGLGALPAPFRELASCPIVSVVPADDVTVPDEIATRIRRAHTSDIPSATRLFDDDRVLVAMGAVRDIGHEMIHVAQVFATPVAMARALDAAADVGERVYAAGASAIAGGRDPEEHRDLAVALRFAARDNADLEGAGAYHATFDLHMIAHPVAATEALGRELGLSRSATAAAVFAAALRRSGFDDPGANVAREVVAHTFAGDPAAMSHLAEDALTAARTAAPRPSRAGELSPSEADVELAGLPSANAGQVVLNVTSRDLAVVNCGRPGAKAHPYLKALHRILPAVAQPVFERVDGVPVATGRVMRGQPGSCRLEDGFGEGVLVRKLVFDRKALAHRLSHLGADARGVLADVRSGSEERGLQRDDAQRQRRDRTRAAVMSIGA